MQDKNGTTTDADEQNSKELNYRRKRVNRIKTTIVIIVIICLILPTILCIILGFQVNRLQKQMNQFVDLHSQYDLSYEKSGNENYAYAAEITSSPANKDETSKATQSETIPVPSIQQVESDNKEAGNKDADIQEATTDITSTDQIESETGDENLDPEQINIDDGEADTEKGSSNNQSLDAENDESTVDSTGIYAGKKVYLTFDDGPSIYTDDILDILADYNVKATFFVVGKTDSKSKKLYKRIVKEGHTLGMHSFSHKYEKIYNSVEDFDKDFTKLWKLLYDTTGYKPSIYRFPGGSDNLVNKSGMEEFIQYLNDKSIVYFDWNVVNGDATGISYSKNQLISNVLGGVEQKKRSIVLMHDSQAKKSTVESLPGLLDKLVAGGAQILPLDEEVPPIQMIKADSVK